LEVCVCRKNLGFKVNTYSSAQREERIEEEEERRKEEERLSGSQERR